MADKHIKNNQFVLGSGNMTAGRDIYNYYSQQNVTMKALITAYKKEQEKDEVFNSIIEELEYYLKPVKSETTQIIGLEQKLKDGQFDHLVNFALAAKDIFVKKVDKHRLSKSAQKIFVYILADIYRIFSQQIYELIISNAGHGEIIKKIDEEIIEKISTKLDDNILDICSVCISGMLYYLTGNCHIKWSAK